MIHQTAGQKAFNPSQHVFKDFSFGHGLAYSVVHFPVIPVLDPINA
jgi:hypothetical protein